MKNWLQTIVFSIFLALPVSARADFPDKPVRLIVPFPAGSAPDILARTYAERLKALWGQPVLIDNRPGATGAIGSELLVRSSGDGYTQLLNSSALLVNPWLTKQRFDLFKDLAPVVRTAQTPYVVLISAKLPVKNFSDFISLARKYPGKYTCATYGIASPPHLSLELLKQEAKVFIVHVPYSSVSPLPDLISGTLDCAIYPPATQQTDYVRAGSIRAIANTGDKVMLDYPDAQPFGEQFPFAKVVGWQGIFAPATTPEPLLNRIRGDWVKVLSEGGVVQKIKDVGFQPMTDSLDQFRAAMKSEYESFGQVIKSRGIKNE
jgi:tripartite-type tricarboxylate transporter receptor subunit TctC